MDRKVILDLELDDLHRQIVIVSQYGDMNEMFKFIDTLGNIENAVESMFKLYAQKRLIDLYIDAYVIEKLPKLSRLRNIAVITNALHSNSIEFKDKEKVESDIREFLLSLPKYRIDGYVYWYLSRVFDRIEYRFTTSIDFMRLIH